MIPRKFLTVPQYKGYAGLVITRPVSVNNQTIGSETEKRTKGRFRLRDIYHGFWAMPKLNKAIKKIHTNQVIGYFNDPRTINQSFFFAA